MNSLKSLKSSLKKNRILVFILVVFAPKNSLAALDLAATAGLSAASEFVTSSQTVTTNSEKYFSGGIWANLIFPQSELGFSTGLQYVQEGANLSFNNSLVIDVKGPYLQIPLTFNLWPTEWTSVGLGIYGGVPLSNINWDFGLALNGQIKIPLGVVTFLMVNLVYEYGLSNLDNSGNTVRNNTLLLQGGVGLNF